MRNEDVLIRANLKSIKCILLQLQLCSSGHVARMEDTTMPKGVMFGEISVEK